MSASQPKVLYLLSWVQMWKFFSHYGIRAILVLYMINYLHLSDSHAFGINAIFCSLVELGGIFGGILADRYLGLRRAMMLGGWLLGTGYVCLLYEKGFLLSLGLIILGGSLFSSNITALVGLAYSEHDSRRDKGFTIFYMAQNLGALVSTFLCAVIATQYSFQAGFAVASIGMIVSNLSLFVKRDLLPQTEITKKQALVLFPVLLLTLGLGTLAMMGEIFILPILPWATGGVFCFFAFKLLKDSHLPKGQVRKLLVYLGGILLFFAAQDQICSSLILFAERETNRILFGWTIPSSVMMSLNPVVIILVGMLITRMRLRFITPFILVAISFGGLALMCLLHLGLSFFGVLGAVIVISIAELMIGPLVSSYASEVAARGRSGMIMGMVPIAFSLAFLLGGGFSKMVAIDENAASLQTYGAGFGKIALMLLAGGILLQLLMKRAVCKG